MASIEDLAAKLTSSLSSIQSNTSEEGNSSRFDLKSEGENFVFATGANYRDKTNDTLWGRRYALNTYLRGLLSICTLLIVATWLWKVGEILGNNNAKYCLSDNVLITLLGTTTLNVLGILYIVLKDLFNGNSEK